MVLSTLLFFSFLFGSKPAGEIPASIYDFKVAALDGSVIDFSQFKGQKILIVNTASKCGFTPQYEALQKLSVTYKDKLIIVGFPSNNFLFQEPGSAKDIAVFCQAHYGVTFPIAAKISVKGRSKAPIYEWLTNKKYNKLTDSKVKWNFQKYLINEKGDLVHIFPPSVKPDDAEVIKAIEE